MIKNGHLFKKNEHFKLLLKDYMIQQGFEIFQTHNKHRLFSVKYEILGCSWKIIVSPPASGVSFLKPLTYIHHCTKLHRNVEPNAKWVASKLQTYILNNPAIDVPTMRKLLRLIYGVSVRRYTLYRA